MSNGIGEKLRGFAQKVESGVGKAVAWEKSNLPSQKKWFKKEEKAVGKWVGKEAKAGKEFVKKEFLVAKRANKRGFYMNQINSVNTAMRRKNTLEYDIKNDKLLNKDDKSMLLNRMKFV